MRQAKGQAIINLINIDQDELVQSVLTTSLDLKEEQGKFLFMATRSGVVKKSRLQAYQNI